MAGLKHARRLIESSFMAASDTTAPVSRPQRWDSPFGPDMTAADVDRLLARPEIAAIQAARFPPQTPLREILLNDTRLVRFQPGDLIVREGDYGNSAFLVLAGKVRVVLAPGLPPDLLGRGEARQKSWWEALSQLWRNRRVPEVRTKLGAEPADHRTGPRRGEERVFLQDVPAILNATKPPCWKRRAVRRTGGARPRAAHRHDVRRDRGRVAGNPLAGAA